MRPAATICLSVFAPCLALLGLAACGLAFGPGASSSAPHQQTASYAVRSSVAELVVHVRAGNVLVAGADKAGISVTEHISYSAVAPAITRRLAGGTLELSYSCPAEADCGVSYDILVPRDLELRLADGAGSIKLSSLAGQVAAAVGAGPISCQALSGSHVTLSTGAGDIDAVFTAAPAAVDATSQAGAVTLRLPAQDRYRVIATAGVGETRVSVPRNSVSQHIVTATTRVGNVTVSARGPG